MKSFDVYLLGKYCCLILYFFLAAQGAFYLLAFGKVFKTLPPDSFLQIRKATETVIEKPLKILYPTATFSMLLWVMYANKHDTDSFLLLVVSLLMLLTDLILAVKVSIPLNQRIARFDNSFSTEVLRAKQKWIRLIIFRGYFSVTGFGILVLHLLLTCQFP